MRRLAIRELCAVSLLLALGVALPRATAQDFKSQARALRSRLVESVLPYWYRTTVDTNSGGYVLSDDAARKAPPATEKQIVTQARMLWGFSHAARKGLTDGKYDYLDAARQGYEFIRKKFFDPEHGGYYWTTDLEGNPLDRRKIVYGESFVIYGFVEYYRASGDRAALTEALELFRTLQTRAHDAKHGGWVEHFEADWTPILDRSNHVNVEVAGYKSANTHLHLMESLTELYAESHDPAVGKALGEALMINKRWFYPKRPGQAAFHRQPDWGPVTDPGSAGLSYGHNVEFAWLMIRAEQVLGRNPSWNYFNAYLQHALALGYDHTRGGLYSRGVDDQPATDTDKVWWVQAEMLAALTDSLKHRFDPLQAEALNQLLDFVRRYQCDRADGVWLDTVAADGTPKVTMKAHNWKGNYHDVRAIVKFIEAFGTEPGAAGQP